MNYAINLLKLEKENIPWQLDKVLLKVNGIIGNSTLGKYIKEGITILDYSFGTLYLQDNILKYKASIQPKEEEINALVVEIAEAHDKVFDEMTPFLMFSTEQYYIHATRSPFSDELSFYFVKFGKEGQNIA